MMQYLINFVPAGLENIEAAAQTMLPLWARAFDAAGVVDYDSLCQAGLSRLEFRTSRQEREHLHLGG